MKRFSKKWAYDVLRIGANNLKNSDIEPEIKEIVETLPVFIMINCQLRSTAGQLNVVRKNELFARKIPKDKKHWTVPVDGKDSYLCIEMSAHHIYWDPSYEVSNTIIHELGHAINFVDEGYENRHASDWHNHSWEEVHLALGKKPKKGSDLANLPAYINLYHEMALKFENELID